MRRRRRDFHRYPETGWAEFRTTAVIADALEPLGWTLRLADEYICPDDVMGRAADPEEEKARAVRQGANPAAVAKLGEYTGLCAELDTGADGPVTALRFDIDCVDVTEASDDEHLPAREGFASVNPGRMHSCGHDGHAAIGIALAEMLSIEETRAALGGKIRLLFQPAEEGVRGGYAMSRAGVADDADNFIALHLGLGRPTGDVCGGIGGFLCTEKIDAVFRGISAHSGGEPHKGRNALLGAATAALNLHAIAPHSDGTTRINVGVMQAGDGRNVIAQNALLKIETRGETDDLKTYVSDRTAEVLEGAARMYGLSLSVTLQGAANTAESTPELAALVAEIARTTPGVNKISERGHMPGSDDAAWLMKRVQDNGGRAVYIGVGADTSAGHHNDRFDFDETAMDIALEVLYRTVRRLHG